MDDETATFMRHWWANAQQALLPNKWLGVPCWQQPCDAWMIQEIIGETQPDVIIETGTFAGGGAILWASLLQMWGGGHVYTIDLEQRPLFVDDRAARAHPLAEHIEFVTGSSTDPKVVQHVADRTAGRRRMVILDSDHSAAHVLAELDAWSPIVTPGCYMIVQDGIVSYVDRTKVPGPLEAIKEWVLGHSEFAIDEQRERMLVTFCPSGFLRRRDE